MIGAATGAVLVGNAYAADLAAPEAIVEAAVPSIWDVAFGVKLTSDYVFRGISQSNGNPAVQGYAELQVADWVYAGVWASSVDLPERRGLTDPAAEIDIYGGIRHSWDAFTLDVGGLYYWYPGENKQFPGQKQIDYWEIYAKPSYAIGDLTIGATVYWTSDYVGSGANATFLSGTAKYNIAIDSMPDVSFYASGELGKQWIKRNSYFSTAEDYLTWNVGVGATYKAATLDLRYSGADLNKNECFANSGARSWCGDRFMASLSFDTAFSKLK
jgi:uncharacterized protein (TIGR02001 family)